MLKLQMFVLLVVANVLGQQVTIKGFYIGMPEKEVVKLINEKYQDYGLEEAAVTKTDGGKTRARAWQNLDPENGFAIATNEDKKLFLLFWNPGVVNKLFNISDLSTKEFAEKFFESYKIKAKYDSTIEPTRVPVTLFQWKDAKIIHRFWKYVSPEGYSIIIKDYTTKCWDIDCIEKEEDRSAVGSIRIITCPKSSERGFN